MSLNILFWCFQQTVGRHVSVDGIASFWRPIVQLDESRALSLTYTSQRRTCSRRRSAYACWGSRHARRNTSWCPSGPLQLHVQSGPWGIASCSRRRRWPKGSVPRPQRNSSKVRGINLYVYKPTIRMLPSIITVHVWALLELELWVTLDSLTEISWETSKKKETFFSSENKSLHGGVNLYLFTSSIISIYFRS